MLLSPVLKSVEFPGGETLVEEHIERLGKEVQGKTGV